MIRTANLTHSLSRNAGGLFESVRRLVQTLKGNGMEVCVFGAIDAHTEEDFNAWEPVKVRAFKPRWPRQLGYSAEFKMALAEFAPDLVHTHGIWLYPSVATNQYCRRRGTPYIISAHGMLDPWAIRNARWKKAIAYFFYEHAHLRDATCLRALCESEAHSVRKLGLKNPIAVIPNGIDLPAEEVQRIAQNTKPPWLDYTEPGQKVLLFLSRIHPKKGLVSLLHAWRKVQSDSLRSVACRPSSDWLLAIAGWDQGGHEAELKKLCDELRIRWADVRDNVARLEAKNQKRNGQAFGAPGSQNFSVLFLGPQFKEGKAVCYFHCDAFILPSFSEGLPMVVLEAWAYGKPVMMTPECNLTVGFARGAAIRIEPSIEGIAQGLNELFATSSAERQALGTRGVALVREQFTWGVIGREMSLLYDWTLGKGAKPACITDF